MARDKKPRTIGDALANPRNARERAFVAKMNALTEAFAKSAMENQAILKAIGATKSPTLIDYDTLNRPDRFLVHINEAISRVLPLRKPQSRPGRRRVKGDEAAFAEVRDLLSRRKDLTDYSACTVVAKEHGLIARNFYKRWLREKKRT
jgi:hypothetical protein